MFPDMLYLGLAMILAFGVWHRFFRSSLSKIPGPVNDSLLLGNMGQLFDPNTWAFHKYIAEAFGSASRVRWLLGKDALYVFDPLALHYILVKEMDIYEEEERQLLMLEYVFGQNLLSSVGAKHKRQRKMLNPCFSMKHMRDIQPALHPVTREITNYVENQVEGGPKEVNILKVMSRAALEYLGRGGLGQSFGPLNDDRATVHSEAIGNLRQGMRVLLKMMKLFTISLSPVFMKTMHLQALVPFLSKFGSPAFRRRVLELLPFEVIHESLSVIDILHEEATSVVAKRKAALCQEEKPESTGQGHDILSVLLKENMSASAEDRLPDSEVVGQVNLLIFAGQDTTSHALSRIFYQLAHHQDEQSKLRDEVREARKDNGGKEFDYDTVNSLPYLDAICRETLRLYSPVTSVSRVAQADTTLPLAFPIKSTDGSPISEIPIKKGMPIVISIFAANRCKKIWGSDAEEWKPERWLKPLTTDVRLPGVYSSMMTFLGGGRACIGFKFSEMEMKLVLSSLIERLVFSPGPEIAWQHVGLARPVVVGDEEAGAKMPLVVSLAEV